MTRKCIVLSDGAYENLLRMIEAYAASAQREAKDTDLWESDREAAARESEQLLAWVSRIKDNTTTQEAVWSQGDIVNWVTK